MMQREYAQAVSEYSKQNIRINKTNFSLLLKRVREKVLVPNNIVKAFETCGYFPFDFTKSYAYKKVPPPSIPDAVVESDDDRNWVDYNPDTTDGDANPSTPTKSHTPILFPPTDVEVEARSRRPLRASRTISKDASPHRQHIHRHKVLLHSLQIRMVAMQGNATPHRARKICREILPIARRDIHENLNVAALYKMVQVQQEIIERLDARHILDNQFTLHLKTQLANRNQPPARGGAALRTGYGGALDAEALGVLEAEQAEKKRKDEEKKQENERKKQERAEKKAVAEQAKVAKAVEKAAGKVDKAAAAEERRIAKGYGRNARGGRGVQRGGRGRGRGRGRGGVRSLQTAQPFPLDEELDENIQELTKEHPQTSSTSPRKTEIDEETSSDESNSDISDTSSVHSDVSTVAHTDVPEVPEASEAPGGRTRARRNIGMPQRYRT
jgi:hypothetical protein